MGADFQSAPFVIVGNDRIGRFAKPVNVNSVEGYERFPIIDYRDHGMVVNLEKRLDLRTLPLR